MTENNNNQTQNDQPVDNESVRIWYVPRGKRIREPFAVVQVPGEENLMLLPGPHATARVIVRDVAQACGATLLETEGVTGLASTDPHWDGRSQTHCRRCRTTHGTDQLVAENLYLRGGAS